MADESPAPVHVIPVDDWFEHPAGPCLCGPRIELIERWDGSVAELHVHHSLDGREAHESQ